MKLKVYAVYDSKVQTYDKPIFMRSRGEAVRSWDTVANDPSTQFFKYPEDYSLMEIAEYDDETGTFENAKVPQNLGLASAFRKPTAIHTEGAK